MQGPSAISHAVGRSRGYGCFLLGIWLAALAAVCYAAWTQPLAPSLPWQCLGLLASGTWAWLAWWRSPTGLLQWDGEHWFWTESGATQMCGVHLQWDFQRLAWVRLQPQTQRTVWLCIAPARGASGAHASWQALRRALVHARAEFTKPTPGLGLEGLP